MVLAALLLSGIAGVANQVVWQRALKIFLGGSEALSSMTVVLVFMLGLGVGAVLMARRAERIERPLQMFGIIALALALVNAAIALFLTADISETVYAVQRATMAVGVHISRGVRGGSGHRARHPLHADGHHHVHRFGGVSATTSTQSPRA